MPELPEVETIRRGILPHVLQRRVVEVRVRNRRLRWPVPAALARELPGRVISHVERRAKYLLLRAGDRYLILHLGMSGRLSVVAQDRPPLPHDHLDIVFDDGQCLRLHDPRRFGAALWLAGDPMQHALLRNLGPEPLSDDFTTDHLFRLSRGRSAPIKNFLMDGHIVVGVGNIYASESLFLAGIRPQRPAGGISKVRYAALQSAVRRVLEAAIIQGGTTLRDFAGADGNPGYFQQQLQVYGRKGEACRNCGSAVRQLTLGQRSSFYCPRCQR